MTKALQHTELLLEARNLTVHVLPRSVVAQPVTGGLRLQQFQLRAKHLSVSLTSNFLSDQFFTTLQHDQLQLLRHIILFTTHSIH